MRSQFSRAAITSCALAVIGLLSSVALTSAEMAAPPAPGAAAPAAPGAAAPGAAAPGTPGAAAPGAAAAAAGAAKPFNCDQPPAPVIAGGASVAQGSAESLQDKNWQPEGGLIQFTINSFEAIDPNASVTTCFRWKLTGDTVPKGVEARPTRVEMTNGGKTLKVTVEVPDPGANEPRSHFDPSIARRVWVVPLAEVRIIALKGQTVQADVRTDIGITRPFISLLLALIVVILGLVALNIAVNYRVRHDGILKANWLLRIISTPAATASLSQLQMLIWTFVVAGSAVYVATLSGQMVEITTGTLILLGISGAATLASQAQGANQVAAKQAEADKAARAAQQAQQTANANPATQAVADDAQAKAAAAQAKAESWNKPPSEKTPQWSDLIVNEGGDGVREVDVARVQMLLFTLISAIFVVVKVIAAYVIPEIPVGYLTLMGISNGVYVGSKVVKAS